MNNHKKSHRLLSLPPLFTICLCLGLPSLATASSAYTWEQMESGTTSPFGSGSLGRTNTLSVYSSTFAVAVTQNDTVLYYNGESWTSFPGSTTAFSGGPYEAYRGGIAISSPERVYIANYGGSNSNTRRLFQGNSNTGVWTTNTRPSGANERLTSVWANIHTSDNRVVAGVLSQGLWWSSTGGGSESGVGWTKTLDHNGDPLGGTFEQIKGTADNNIFALQSTGDIYHSSDGGVTVGTPITSPTGTLGIHTLNAASLWAVGSGGGIHFWNGTSFTEQLSPTTETLFNVHAFALDNVWVVGANNTLIHYDGDSWQLVDTGLEDTYQFFDIGGDELGNLYIVGSNGLILHGIAAIPELSFFPLILALSLIALSCTRRRMSKKHT